MNYLIGIEREGFRIDSSGNMSKTLHPKEFGDKFENPLISTDFGEAMLELRTYPQPSPEACYKQLLDVTYGALKIIYKNGEYLWPYSVPFNLPREEEFCYNLYPGRPDEEEYERVITKKHGLGRMCLAGIHLNFSISEESLSEICSLYPSVPKDRDEVYLKCADHIVRHEMVFRHFFDGSPSTFEGTILENDSLRNSPAGFRDEKAKLLDYSGKEAYLKSLKLMKSYERLSAVRLKSIDKANFDEGIAEHGIERLEFRLCDIDPFDICGISLNEIKLAVAILFLCMVRDEIPDTPIEILRQCDEVNSKLGLGLDSEIKNFIEQEKSGITKNKRVRNYLKENGFEGLIKLAYQYGSISAEYGDGQF